MRIVYFVLGGFLGFVAFLVLLFGVGALFEVPIAGTVLLLIGSGIGYGAVKICRSAPQESNTVIYSVKSDQQLDEQGFGVFNFYELDLSKLSLVGCLFLLSTLAVIGLVGIPLLMLFPANQRENRGAMRITMIVGFAAAAGYFWGGRIVLNRMGFSLFRTPKQQQKKRKQAPSIHGPETGNLPPRSRR